MAQVHKSVTHLAQAGDCFILPWELVNQVEYFVEDGNGQRYSMVVDKPEIEFCNSERDRFECGEEIYQGVG